MAKMKMAFALLMLVFLSSCSHVILEKDPLSMDEHLRLGAIYESKGEYELALKEYQKAIEENGKNADAYFGMGNVYFKIKNYKDSETNFLKAVELNPDKGAYRNNLGWLYVEQGDFTEAEDSAREAIRVDPENKYIYLDTLGMALTKQAEYLYAEEAYIEAAKLYSPQNMEGLIEIYNHLLDLYKISGEQEKAAIIEKAIKDFKDAESLAERSKNENSLRRQSGDGGFERLR
ncbi:MAG: tetratricopeptide repeat protein [Deltaproteobacteria bacterium]|nr:tetratricopeptide repeat protein [Deltaproteobacteria bacterium]